MQETWVQSLGWEDPLEKGMAYLLQYSGLENFTDRGAWQATVHGVAKSRTGLSDFHFHTYSRGTRQDNKQVGFPNLLMLIQPLGQYLTHSGLPVHFSYFSMTQCMNESFLPCKPLRNPT